MDGQTDSEINVAKVVGIFFCKVLLLEGMTKVNIWTSYYGNTFRRIAEKIMLRGQDKFVVIV
jgi:hypothetical protein